MMTANHVGSLYSEGRLGFGLGFEICEHVGRAARPDSVGTFGWGSAYYSTYWVDPQEKLVAILLTQLIPAGTVDLREKFRYWSTRRSRARFRRAGKSWLERFAPGGGFTVR